MPPDTLSELVTSYMVTALWSSNDGDKNLYEAHTILDISPETRATMKADCEKFLEDNFDLIFGEGMPVAAGSGVMAAHDLWLTRCGHGAGFWDGDWPEPAATKLTEYAEKLGNVDLYVGDDGKIYA